MNKPNPWTGVGPFTDKKTNSTDKPQATPKPQGSGNPPSLMSTIAQKPPAKSWVPKAQPAWGPLIWLVPNYQMPVPENDIRVSACFGLCGGVTYGARSGWSWSAGVGLKAEMTVSTGVSLQESAPLYVVGECSATALVGGSAHLGLGIADKQDSPGGLRIAGTSGGGIKYGFGGGCKITLTGSF